MREPTSAIEPPRTRQLDALAGRIYGLIIVGAALAVVRPDAESRWTVVLDVGAAALIYSAAHAYARVLGERLLLRRPLTWAERREIAIPEFMILRATALPFIALVVCDLFGTTTAVSVDVAIGFVVAELTVTSWLAGSGLGSNWRRAGYAAGALGLGLLLIVLKIITH